MFDTKKRFKVVIPCANPKNGITTGLAIGDTIHFGIESFIVTLDDPTKFWGTIRSSRSKIVNVFKSQIRSI